MDNRKDCKMDTVIKWEIGQIAEKIGLEVDIPLWFPDPPDPGKGKFIVRRCKTCKHWNLKAPDIHNNEREDILVKAGYGDCSSRMAVYTYNPKREDLLPDRILVEIDEGWGFVTGPDFGCIHWEQNR
jgi:hypothetical protein